MMFRLDLAFAAEIIALGMGLAFLVWACHNKGDGRGLAKFSGFLIISLAVISMLCTTYYGLSYWSKGYFMKPMGMMNTQSMPLGRKMMSGQRQDCPRGAINCPRAMGSGQKMQRPEQHMQGKPGPMQMMPQAGEHMGGSQESPENDE